MQSPPDHTKALTAAGLNLIAQALTIYDDDLRLAVCNAPFQKMFDLPDWLVTPGAHFEDTIRHLAQRGEYGPVDDLESFVRERVEQARAFEPHYMERPRADGRFISVEGSPLPQGGWVTVYTDITAAKAQEALLRERAGALSDQVLAHSERLAATNRELGAMNAMLEETKRQLTESEARTRLTTEMMPAHIAHVNAQGRYIYSNRRLSAVMPGRPSNIIGQHVRDALGAPAFARVENALHSALHGTPAVVEFTYEASARRIRGAFTPDGRGGVYILSMDVTEETQARVALQQSSKRELAAQMISGLAHDFSNLLTIILGLQSRLARFEGLPAAAAPLVEGTSAAARRGGALLTSIADMTGPRIMRPVATQVSTVLDDLALLAQPTLPDGIALTVDDQCGKAALLLDKGLVQDSLLNLILNARDACGTSGTITLRARLIDETWVEFRMRDSGPGFSKLALTRGLDPFFTTKGSEGSGLGLPMVYDMTKLAGGDLRLGNYPGGAEVTLRLPFRAAMPATTGLVLLVEDEDALRTMLRDMLMSMGHSVIEAASVDEAIALTADLPDITLVLSDIQLAGSATGVDLARRLNASKPLILMTSLPASDPHFLEAQKHAPVLHKPFAASDLQALISPATVAAQ
ncbi:MAG: PAS-domain containing protein [Sulfitobacter sp.]